MSKPSDWPGLPADSDVALSGSATGWATKVNNWLVTTKSKLALLKDGAFKDIATGLGTSEADKLVIASLLGGAAGKDVASALNAGNADKLPPVSLFGSAAGKDTGASDGEVPILGTGGKLASSVIPDDVGGGGIAEQGTLEIGSNELYFGTGSSWGGHTLPQTKSIDLAAAAPSGWYLSRTFTAEEIAKLILIPVWSFLRGFDGNSNLVAMQRFRFNGTTLEMDFQKLLQESTTSVNVTGFNGATSISQETATDSARVTFQYYILN